MLDTKIFPAVWSHAAVTAESNNTLFWEEYINQEDKVPVHLRKTGFSTLFFFFFFLQRYEMLHIITLTISINSSFRASGCTIKYVFAKDISREFSAFHQLFSKIFFYLEWVFHKCNEHGWFLSAARTSVTPLTNEVYWLSLLLFWSLNFFFGTRTLRTSGLPSFLYRMPPIP